MGHDKSKFGNNPKPETLAKLNLAKRLLAEEYDVHQITKMIGYKDVCSTRALLRGFEVNIPRELCGYDSFPDEQWFAGKADPSGLSEDELERARNLDISPERWAWLKTCPKGGITKFDFANYFNRSR